MGTREPSRSRSSCGCPRVPWMGRLVHWVRVSDAAAWAPGVRCAPRPYWWHALVMCASMASSLRRICSEPSAGPACSRSPFEFGQLSRIARLVFACLSAVAHSWGVSAHGSCDMLMDLLELPREPSRRRGISSLCLVRAVQDVEWFEYKSSSRTDYALQRTPYPVRSTVRDAGPGSGRRG